LENQKATGQPVLRSAQDYKVPSGRDIPAPWFGSEMSEIHEMSFVRKLMSFGTMWFPQRVRSSHNAGSLRFV